MATPKKKASRKPAAKKATKVQATKKAAIKKVPAKPKLETPAPVIKTEDRPKLEIQKALCVSSNHITMDDNDFLGSRNRHQGTSFSHMIGPFGYMIYCSDEPEFIDDEPVSLALRNLMHFAREQGCCYLHVDRDGLVLENFPTFEWC